jgi:hypothetical protein
MKDKGGRLAPRPRPVATKKNKKQAEVREAVQRQGDVRVEDADQTLVEQTEQSELHEVTFSYSDWSVLTGCQSKAKVRWSAKDRNAQAVSGGKNVNTRSKKLNKAPWEIQDFTGVKIEMTEEVKVGFDTSDDLPTKDERAPPDIVNEAENNDLPLPHEGILEDIYVRVQSFSRCSNEFELCSRRRQNHILRILHWRHLAKSGLI